MSTTSALAFAQQQFDGAYKNAEAELTKIERALRSFVIQARILKGVAVFGGLLITSGYVREYNQLIGFLISLAVAYDAFVSGHKRTMSRAAASSALRQLLSVVRSEHTDAIQVALPLRDSEPAKFAEQMIGALTALRKRLEVGLAAVRTALDQSNYEALQALALEAPAKHQ